MHNSQLLLSFPTLHHICYSLTRAKHVSKVSAKERCTLHSWPEDKGAASLHWYTLRPPRYLCKHTWCWSYFIYVTDVLNEKNKMQCETFLRKVFLKFFPFTFQTFAIRKQRKYIYCNSLWPVRSLCLKREMSCFVKVCCRVRKEEIGPLYIYFRFVPYLKICFR